MTEATGTHPDLGSKTPNDLTTTDILALPEREREAWIHGAVTMIAQTTAFYDAVSARCVMDWYFQNEENQKLIPFAMERYPEQRASSVTYGVAALACEGLKSAEQ